MRRLSESEKSEMWDRLETGESMRSVARRFGCAHSSVRRWVALSGFRRPVPGVVVEWSPRRLSLVEREEISRGVAAGESLRSIGRRLGRAASTVSREVASNGGRGRYRAMVEDKLELWWSPQQISAWLRDAYPSDEEMRVSHETIYQTLFIQARGGLRHELWRCLRTGRATRRPQGGIKTTRAGQIREPVMISERSAEVEDRAVPGHWEGDLVMGKRKTAIGTLVERHSRYLMLFPLPDGNTAEAVRTALGATMQQLPKHLWRSLTWDQGKEMAEHAQFTIDTGLQIYFCDPRSPWQRGTNENTNGLLRQYFPKKTDMCALTQDELDAAAHSLNTRPRQTLGWMTPSQVLAKAVATTT